jgi:hypothetical protein
MQAIWRDELETGQPQDSVATVRPTVSRNPNPNRTPYALRMEGSPRSLQAAEGKASTLLFVCSRGEALRQGVLGGVSSQRDRPAVQHRLRVSRHPPSSSTLTAEARQQQLHAGKGEWQTLPWKPAVS